MTVAAFEELLKRIGSLLRPDSGAIAEGLKQLRDVFTGDSEISILSLHQRRVCLFIINCISIVPFLGSGDSAGARDFPIVFSQLIGHLARLDVVMCDEFIAEFVHVTSLTMELVKTLNTSTGFEVFGGFVALIKRAFSGSDDASNRGIPWTFVSHDHAVVALNSLCHTWSHAIDQGLISLSHVQVSQLAETLLGRGDQGSVKALLVQLCALSSPSTKRKIHERLGSIPSLDFPQSSAWLVPSLVDLGKCSIVRQNVPDPGTAIAPISRSDGFESSLRLAQTSMSATQSDAPLDQITCLDLDPGLRSELSDATGKRAVMQMIPNNRECFLGTTFSKRLSSLLWLASLCGKPFESLVRQEGLPCEITLQKCLVSMGACDEASLVVRALIDCASSGTMTALDIAAQYVAPGRSVEDLLVDNLAECLAVFFLLCTSQTELAGKINALMVEIIGAGRNEFSALVDGAGGKLIVAIVRRILTGNDSSTEAVLAILQNVVGYLPQGTIREVAGTKRKRKVLLESCEEEAEEQQRLVAYLESQYLHVLQILEDDESAQSRATCRILELFVSCAGRRVVTQYSSKTLEVLIKTYKGNRSLWSTFCDVIEKDMLIAILPAVLVHGGPDLRLPIETSRGLNQLMGSDCGEIADVADFVLEEVLKKDGARPLSVKVSLLRLLNDYLRRTRSQLQPSTHNASLRAVADAAGSLMIVNAGDVECLIAVSAILGEIGCFTRELRYFDAAPAVSDISNKTRRSVQEIAVDVLVEFSIPKLKIDAYALCAQEILAHFGGKSLLESIKSETARATLKPYLHTKYRFAGALPGQCSSQTGAQVINCLEWIFDSLPQNSEFRSLITCARYACDEDKSLALFLLPFAFDALCLSHPPNEIVDQARLRLLGPSSLMTSHDSLAVNAGVKVLDHLHRIETSAEVKQILDDLPLSIIVRACIRSNDWPRALFYFEQLYWQKGVKNLRPIDLKTLGEIYAGLQDELGLQGVITMANKTSSNISKTLETAALELAGDFVQLSGKLDATDSRSRAHSLMKIGRYHTALDLVSGKACFEDIAIEASWKTNDWIRLADLVESYHFNETSSFASRYGALLAEFHRTGSLQSETVISVRSWLARRLMSVRSSETISQMHVVEDFVWLTSIPASTRHRVASFLIRRADRAPDEFRADILEANAAALRVLHLETQAEELDTAVLRACRKSGRLDLAKQLLASRISTRLASSFGSAAVWQRTKEVAKIHFALNQVEIARTLIEENRSGTEDSWASELTSLRWSCRLNLLAPREAVFQWRDLLRRAQSRPLAKDKEKVSFSFAEYLDGILVEVWENRGRQESFDLKTLATETVRHYLVSLQNDLDNKRTLFTLNRVVQIYAELCISSHADIGKSVSDTILVEYKKISGWIWLAVIEQLVTRAVDREGKVNGVFLEIVGYVLTICQDHAAWYVVPWTFSNSPHRRHAFTNLIEKCQLKNYDQIRTFIECLLSVARYKHYFNGDPAALTKLADCRDGRKLMTFCETSASRVVLPVQRVIGYEAAFRNAKLTPQEIAKKTVYIQKWEDVVYELNSKARPKRLRLVDSDGNCHFFLCKSEKKVDLRKDARVMDLANVINKEIFAKSPEAARRGLQITTYSVVPLCEDAALIEWVDDLIPLRQAITESQSNRGVKIEKPLDDKLQGPGGLAYFESLCARNVAVLHEWFFRSFRDPEQWLRARRRFAHSLAVWSMFGFVIGLGDRHSENILIHKSGQIVHVDFECIFRKGLTLNVPELVPFRLTQNFVAALGPTGVEGTFRETCELVNGLLRKHRTLLSSVLSVFTADTIMEETSRNMSTAGIIQKIQACLKVVDRKLQGSVDVGAFLPIAQTDDPLLSYSEKDPRSVLGRDRGNALSVETQVDHLINAAMCNRNLSKMYSGWAAML